MKTKKLVKLLNEWISKFKTGIRFEAVYKKPLYGYINILCTEDYFIYQYSLIRLNDNFYKLLTNELHKIIRDDFVKNNGINIQYSNTKTSFSLWIDPKTLYLT